MPDLCAMKNSFSCTSNIVFVLNYIISVLIYTIDYYVFHIARDIHDLHDISKGLNEMINEQGQHIDRIGKYM